MENLNLLKEFWRAIGAGIAFGIFIDIYKGDFKTALLGGIGGTIFWLLFFLIFLRKQKMKLKNK